MARQLTANVVSGACIRVTVGAAEVQLESVSLVRNQVGVSVRGLSLGELRSKHETMCKGPAYKAYRFACFLNNGGAGDKDSHGRGSSKHGSREEHGGKGMYVCGRGKS